MDQPDRLPEGLTPVAKSELFSACFVALAWSADGTRLAAAGDDGALLLFTWPGLHEEAQWHTIGRGLLEVSWAPDSRRLAVLDADGRLQILDVESRFWTPFEELGGILSISWSPGGNRIACAHRREIRLLSAATLTVEQRLPVDWWENRTVSSQGEVSRVLWSPSAFALAHLASDQVRVYHFKPGSRELDRTVDVLAEGKHLAGLQSIAWWANGNLLAIGDWDGNIILADPYSGEISSTLEGHEDVVTALGSSHDGGVVASKSWDHTIWFRRTDTWDVVATLREKSSANRRSGLAFHPHAPLLATLGAEDRAIRVWRLEVDRLLARPAAVESLEYLTGKLVLVGDSGVGKTGLGWRIAHGQFREQSSTHGQQFWVVDTFGHRRGGGTECEAVLWDLAGQPDYRLVHSLFLDDVQVALLVFDPTARQEPLGSVLYWLKQLGPSAEQRCAAVLVGARVDRGAPTLTAGELEAFCKAHGITGGFVLTSALTGEGLAELRERVRRLIPWDRMTTTVTTVTFKHIKEHVLALKESRGDRGVLLSPAGLRAELEAAIPDLRFRDAEMLKAVGHLATHGFVTLLQGSRGEVSILLAPDLLANLASSLVLEARRNPRGLGCWKRTPSCRAR